MCVNAALESSTANGKSPVQKSKESLSCKSPCLQNKGLSEIRGVQRPESKDTRGDERLLQVPLKSHCRNWQSCTLCELLWTSCRVFGSVSFHGHCTHSVDVLCVFKGCLSLDMNLPWDVLKQITLCYVIHHMNKMWWVVQAWTGREQHHSTVSGMDPALKRDKEFSRYHWTEHERLFELCNTGRGCVKCRKGMWQLCDLNNCIHFLCSWEVGCCCAKLTHKILWRQHQTCLERWIQLLCYWNVCKSKAYEFFLFFNLRKSQVTIFLGNVDK